jgi:acyl-CoA reductase-like NAD-dependent aldehyde dehydrogenase
MQSYPMLIGGKAVTTTDSDPVINPASGEDFATCPRATTTHLEEAVDAALGAYRTWRTDERLRRAKLKECARAVEENAERLATALSKEQGKPLHAARMEISAVALWFDYFAEMEVGPEIVTDTAEKRVTVLRKPLGVIAAITPWNFPLILMAYKVAPALLAGNTVVAKPSPFTPLSPLLLCQIWKDILPAGTLNILTGGGELGAALASHPQVRKVSFTGSVATGRKVLSYAVDDLKRVTLELGGNDPAIVLDDAVPERVIDGLFWSAFFNSGQVCTAVKRLYVHEKVYDRVVEGLVAKAKSVKVGPGDEDGTELGPLNNAMQLDKLMAMVDDARSQGAHVRSGGERSHPKAYFYPPTIVTEARPGMKLVDEEQFGTALPIIKYARLEDALEQANRTHYGLGGSVWTSNVDRGTEVVQELECGTGWVNHHMDSPPTAPLGGWKLSGLGHENGRWGYDECTQIQVVNARK